TTCFTSFASPLAHDVAELGARLPDPRAAEALYALGVRSIVVHADQYAPEQLHAVHMALAHLSVGNPRLVPLGEADGPGVYRLDSTTPVHSGLDPLAAGAALGFADVQRMAPGDDTVMLTYRNGEATTYRHPDPTEPSGLVVRWYDDTGALVLEREASVML